MSEAVRGQHGFDGGFAALSEAKIRDESGDPLAGVTGTSELPGDRKP